MSWRVYKFKECNCHKFCLVLKNDKEKRYLLLISDDGEPLVQEFKDIGSTLSTWDYMCPCEE